MYCYIFILIYKLFDFEFDYHISYFPNPSKNHGIYRCIATDKDTALVSFEKFKERNQDFVNINIININETPVVNGMEINY